MSESQISTSERLKAARKRFEELKLKNKIPLNRIQKTATESQKNGHDNTETPGLYSEHNSDHINELKETISLQKSQIKKLRDENTELKLEHMDLKDKVVELEKELAQFKDKKQDKNEEIGDKLIQQPEKQALVSGIPKITPSVEITDIAKQHNSNTGDYKERVLAWKGWQVDMRDWNGCQVLQVAL